MHGYAASLTPIDNLFPFSHLLSSTTTRRRSTTPLCFFSLQIHAKSSIPRCIIGCGANSNLFLCSPLAFSPSCRNHHKNGRGNYYSTLVRATSRESPYQVLGVSPSATLHEIKRAYRKLALKYHPDVSKEANAEEKFMRIKHAYNTLLNNEPRSSRKYDSGNRTSSTTGGNQGATTEDEEFYGFGNFLRDVQISIGDLFRDLQEEFRNWEASSASQGKPKSLWEELAEIGEEFVEYLEKELNIVDNGFEVENNDPGPDKGSDSNETKKAGTGSPNESDKGSIIEDNIDEIEAVLAQLRKELGL